MKKPPREPEEEDRYRRRRRSTITMDDVLEERYRRRRTTMDDVLEERYRRHRRNKDDVMEDRYRHGRSTKHEVLEDFCDRCSSSSRPRASNKTDKTTTVKSKTIYAARHSSSRKVTYDEVRSRSEFDRFEKFGEEIDHDQLRRRRKRDREAARVAVDGIRNTAGFENNRDAGKELESICECSAYYVLGRNPLMSLGLFLKPEYSDVKDEDEEAILFGDIHCTEKPYIDMGRRSTQHKVEKQEYGNENIKHCSSGLLFNGPIEATPSCGYATSSPRKDHDRVEMLKLRFKDTILKAQKELGLPADADYNKQEGIGLKTTEVRSRSTTTTEFDHDQLRKRRKRDREAARIAVDGIQETAGLENNRDAMKELESMCECSSFYVLGRYPLISLGLFLKPDYSDINDDEEEAILFGDIHRAKKPYIHMDRSMQHKVQKEEYGNENIKHYSSGLLLNGPTEATPSCGHAMSSPRKAHDRVELLKLRYNDTILKAQRELGLSADYNKEQGIGLKTTSRRSQYCKSKATINAPIKGVY